MRAPGPIQETPETGNRLAAPCCTRLATVEYWGPCHTLHGEREAAINGGRTLLCTDKQR